MKKFLITTLLALTMCLFLAYTVGAEEYDVVDNLGDPDWYVGNYELITDKTSRVVLSNGDGTYTAYPAYYVLKYSITVRDGAVTEAYVNDFDYSFINSKTGKNYELGAIYKIELPSGLTRITSGKFGHKPKEPNIVELVMSDTIVKIDDHAFREMKSMKRVVVSKNITYVGTYCFYRSTALEEVIFPAGSDAVVDTSRENIFEGCTSLKELDLSKKNIKTLGSSFLSGCTNLGKVTLPDTLEVIGYCSLYQNPNMYLASDFLPSSLKTVGFHFLSGCKSINKVLYFPDGFEGFTANYNFSSDKAYAPEITLVFLGKLEGTMNFEQLHTNGGRKFTLIFTKNQFSDLAGNIVKASGDGTMTYIGKTADATNTAIWTQTGTLTISFGSAGESNSKYKVDENGNTLYYISSNSYNVIFCGGDEVEVCYGIRECVVNSQWNKSFTTPVTFDREGHMTKGVHYDLTEVVSLANCGIDGITEHTCVLCARVERDVMPATGDHNVYEVSPCADKCTVCLLYVQKASQSHEIVEYFTYANGFMEKGAYGEKCVNEGCDCISVEEKSALVCDLGYSVPEKGGFVGINYGYMANKSVLYEYERVNGSAVELGVLIATGENFQKDEKIFEFKFYVILDCVEVVINYGDRTDLGDCQLVISAVLYETKDGETTKTCLQGKTDKNTTEYTSATYGTLYGISINSLKN